jgi:hypothetical protein
MALYDKRPVNLLHFNGSEQALKKFTLQGHLREFLRPLAFDATVFSMDDFDGDAINLDRYAVANSGGTSAASFAIAVARNGVIEADTGTDDNGSVSIIGPTIYYGDYNCGMQVRFKIDAVTDLNFEVGLIDAVPAGNAGAVTDEDTPTFAAAEFAGLVMDTDETKTGLCVANVGSVASGTDAVTALTNITTPVAGQWITLRLQLKGNFIYGLVWEESLNEYDTFSLSTDADGHIEGGVALAPWFYARTRTTVARFPQIDYLALWQDRR